MSRPDIHADQNENGLGSVHAERQGGQQSNAERGRETGQGADNNAEKRCPGHIEQRHRAGQESHHCIGEKAQPGHGRRT